LLSKGRKEGKGIGRLVPALQHDGQENVGRRRSGGAALKVADTRSTEAGQGTEKGCVRGGKKGVVHTRVGPAIRFSKCARLLES